MGVIIKFLYLISKTQTFKFFVTHNFFPMSVGAGLEPSNLGTLVGYSTNSATTVCQPSYLIYNIDVYTV